MLRRELSSFASKAFMVTRKANLFNRSAFLSISKTFFQFERKTTLFEIVCVICELLHQWGWWANRWIYGNITTSVSNLHDMILIHTYVYPFSREGKKTVVTLRSFPLSPYLMIQTGNGFLFHFWVLLFSSNRSSTT